jgi:hypothetical protein
MRHFNRLSGEQKTAVTHLIQALAETAAEAPRA